MIPLKDHLDYPDEIRNIIITGQFYELLNFINFSLCKLYGSQLEKIIQCDSKLIIKHVIDNIISVNIFNNLDSQLVHYLMFLDDIKLVNYFVDKYFIDLELQNEMNNKPIHFACDNKNLKMIKYLANKGVDLESPENSNWKPIHSVCRSGIPEIIEYVVNQGVELESEINDGWRPIHLVCHYGDYDSIKLILSKNICLNSRIKLYNMLAADYGVIDLLLMNKRLTFGKQQKLLKIINKKLNSQVIDEVHN